MQDHQTSGDFSFPILRFRENCASKLEEYYPYLFQEYLSYDGLLPAPTSETLTAFTFQTPDSLAFLHSLEILGKSESRHRRCIFV